ncbi:hypothetical protein ABZ858_30740 [Streptomyces sp. NPDC047017]|uniref:hypothetical protein n=1 Tax=Streptomyces sp. NPDC047017 TaxID=3155024 RepID=UPI0033E71F78
MTSSSDRIGGERSTFARAREASSHLRDAACSICLTHRLAVVTQAIGTALPLREPSASSADYITVALSLASQGYQLYRLLKND